MVGSHDNLGDLRLVWTRIAHSLIRDPFNRVPVCLVVRVACPLPLLDVLADNRVARW